MERRGLIRREECATDSRGAEAVLSDEGPQAFRVAALPGQLRGPPGQGAKWPPSPTSLLRQRRRQERGDPLPRRHRRPGLRHRRHRQPRFPLAPPPEELRYRLVPENSRAAWRHNYSTSTPMQLDYAVAGRRRRRKGRTLHRHRRLPLAPAWWSRLRLRPQGRCGRLLRRRCHRAGKRGPQRRGTTAGRAGSPGRRRARHSQLHAWLRLTGSRRWRPRREGSGSSWIRAAPEAGRGGHAGGATPPSRTHGQTTHTCLAHVGVRHPTGRLPDHPGTGSPAQRNRRPRRNLLDR